LAKSAANVTSIKTQKSGRQIAVEELGCGSVGEFVGQGTEAFQNVPGGLGRGTFAETAFA
jgi:hypothetical protein